MTKGRCTYERHNRTYYSVDNHPILVIGIVLENRNPNAHRFLSTCIAILFMGVKLSMLALLWSAMMTWNAASTTFYEAFGSDSLTTIEHALTTLEQTKSSTSVRAYQGGLMMKKANYVKGVAQKLELFKAGSQLLDKAIKRDPSNAEYRFIRLTIQEKAPRILKYNKNIAEDKRILVAGYKSMRSSTRSYVLDYAHSSEQLKVSDFK